MKDRCDRCGAEAFYHATKDKSALSFCIHHGRDAYDVLVMQGWDVHDDSQRINKKPSISGHM